MKKHPEAYARNVTDIIGDRSLKTPRKAFRAFLYAVIILLCAIYISMNLPIALAESITMPRHDKHYLRFVRPYTSEVCNTAVNRKACHVIYHLTPIQDEV